MSDELRQKWDARYHASNDSPAPCRVLRDYAHLLPATGQVLELAAGLGGNALLLAERGLQVMAWDLSPVAIDKLREHAANSGVNIDAQVHDVINSPPAANSFDVIVVSFFLERTLFPALLAALRPGGLLFYETFIRDKPAGVGPSNPDYLLEQNELLRLCDGLVVRGYREEGMLGDLEQGVRNVAMIVGQKDVKGEE